MAPTLLDWQISRYVTFNAGQQEIADRNLTALHEWHRKTQLPVYVDFLDKAVGRLSDDADRPDAAELARWRRQIRDAFSPLLRAMAPGLAEIALTLTPAQLDEIEAAMKEKASERRKNHNPDASAAERREARLERWTKRAEWFLGDLTLLQQARLGHRVKSAPDSRGWWKRSETNQQETVRLLREIATKKPGLEIATRQLEQWLSRYGKAMDEETRRADETLMLASDETMREVLSIATPEQVEHLRGKLSGFAADLRSVSSVSIPVTVNTAK